MPLLSGSHAREINISGMADIAAEFNKKMAAEKEMDEKKQKILFAAESYQKGGALAAKVDMYPLTADEIRTFCVQENEFRAQLIEKLGGQQNYERFMFAIHG